MGYINDAIQKQHMDGKMCCVIFPLFSLHLMGCGSKMLLLKQIVTQATMHFDQIEGNEGRWVRCDEAGWGEGK